MRNKVKNKLNRPNEINKLYTVSKVSKVNEVKNKNEVKDKVITNMFLFVVVFSSLILFSSLALLSPTLVAKEEIMSAMRDEMTRSMNDLHIQDLKKPYFIEYTVRFNSNYQITSVFGMRLDEQIVIPNAIVNVNVRVGDYKFDNSNFVDVTSMFTTTDDDDESFEMRRVPIDLDYNILRRELWLATDNAYKDAAEEYAKKEATMKGVTRKDTTWDFSKVIPIKTLDTFSLPEFDNAKFESIANSASEVFLNYPEFTTGRVIIQYRPNIVYYMNSEGSEYIKNYSFMRIIAFAVAQTKEGEYVYDYYSLVCNSPADFPTKDSILQAAKQVSENVNNLLKAKTIEKNYAGPILFTEQAACELISSVLAPNFAAQKMVSSSMNIFDNRGGNEFQTKIGLRVLSKFITVEDLPSLKEFNKIKLVGSYNIDDESVKPSDVVLVEKGILKTLLSSRSPTEAVQNSNGRKRESSVNISNLKISATDKQKQLSEANLKKELIKLCKEMGLPFGILVKNIVDRNIYNDYISDFVSVSVNDFASYFNRQIGGRGNVKNAVRAYKVYLDGKEELIRDAELIQLSVRAFREVLNVGDRPYVYNTLIQIRYVNLLAASIISPSLLFEEGELSMPTKSTKKPSMLAKPN